MALIDRRALMTGKTIRLAQGLSDKSGAGLVQLTIINPVTKEARAVFLSAGKRADLAREFELAAKALRTIPPPDAQTVSVDEPALATDGDDD